MTFFSKALKLWTTEVRHGYEIMQFFHFCTEIPKVLEQAIAPSRVSDFEEFLLPQRCSAALKISQMV